MYEALRDLLRLIVPRQGVGEDEEHFRWRQTVGLFLLLGGTMSAIHVAWACGYLVTFGLPGFAEAGQLKDTQVAVVDIREAQLDRLIKDAKIANCVAKDEGNQSALSFSSDDLNKRLVDYRRLVGYAYPRIPECSELIAKVK